FWRNVALPMNPLLPVDAKPYGFGLVCARNARNVLDVQLPPLYAAGLPACAADVPLKNARKVGSGLVPGAPVNANVLPRPAAWFAFRLFIASVNSLRKPFSTMFTSFRL